MNHLCRPRLSWSGVLSAFALISLLFSIVAPHAFSMGPKKGKPAKITWSVSRITESMLASGSVTVQFTSNQDLPDGVSVRPTPSLTRFLTVTPSSYPAITAGTAYDVTITVGGSGELTQTVGGTIHIKDGSRTLSKPLNVSLKVDSEETEGEEEEEEEGEEEGENGGSNTIVWTPDVIDETLFDGVDFTTVSFTVSRELGDVCVWITPSASGFLTASPAVFPGPLTPTDDIGDVVVYSFDLTLQPPLASLTRNIGGTVHLRACDASGKLRRTYDTPLPIRITVDPEEEEEEEAVPAAVVSAGDYSESPVSPGQILSIFGEGIGPAELVIFDSRKEKVETYLADTQVLFDGVAAPLLASSYGQVNVVTPLSVAGKELVEMIVVYRGNVSAPIVLPAAPASPSLFTLDGSGRGQGAILNASGGLNTPTNPARRGAVVTLFGSGGGLTENPPEDGTIVVGQGLQLAGNIVVEIDGVPAEVLWAGSPPGMVYGAMQINIRLPFGGLRPGPAPIVVRVGDAASSDAVTVSVQ